MDVNAQDLFDTVVVQSIEITRLRNELAAAIAENDRLKQLLVNVQTPDQPATKPGEGNDEPA